MTFKFATFDPREGPDVFNPAFPPTPSSSPSITLCQPCIYTLTFTKTIVGRLVAAGASLVLTAPASEFHDDQIQDQRAETPFHSINLDVHPEFRQRQLKEFTLKELKVATQNFSDTERLGRGGFGNVYQGRLADGSLVAIKRLYDSSYRGRKAFEKEVKVGSIIPPRHNLLPMLGLCRTFGFCRTSKCRDLLLVYPLMINRSAAWCLRERPVTQTPLDWLTRRKIAMGAARGLSHLHDLNILHRDIKAANILLDDEFEPHIGDFGTASFIDRRHGGYFVDCIAEAPVLSGNESEGGSHSEYSDVTSSLYGTPGHMAPEFFATRKSDVYSFGLTLLELVTGQTAIRCLKNGEYCLLLDWVKALSLEFIVDPDLQGAYDKEEIDRVIQLAFLCTQFDPRERPSMAQVVQILEGHSIEERFERYYFKYYSQELKRSKRNV